MVTACLPLVTHEWCSVHLVHGHQKASLYIDHTVGGFNTLTYTHVTQRMGTGRRIGSHLFLRYIFTESRRNRIQTWTEIQNISLNPGRPVGYGSSVHRLLFQFGTRDEDWKTYPHWVTCAIPMWSSGGGEEVLGVGGVTQLYKVRDSQTWICTLYTACRHVWDTRNTIHTSPHLKMLSSSRCSHILVECDLIFEKKTGLCFL